MKNTELCVSLDVDLISTAISIVKELSPHVNMFKVGSELFTLAGPTIIDMIKSQGCRVFLDLKYHDIPNTVAKASTIATRMGIDMFNMHSLGTFKMMHIAMEAVKNEAERMNIPVPIVLGVTVLTTMNQRELTEDLQIDFSLASYVQYLTKTVKDAGLSGVVCSPLETRDVKIECGNAFVVVNPGIRPEWAKANDQIRITTPKEASNNGADYIVIGRPILDSKDRIESAIKILEELKCS